MKVLGGPLRVLATIAGLAAIFWLADQGAAVVGVLNGPDRDPVVAMALIASVWLVPLALILAALYPRLWPLPGAVTALSVAAIALIEPRFFDFAVQALMQMAAAG